MARIARRFSLQDGLLDHHDRWVTDGFSGARSQHGPITGYGRRGRFYRRVRYARFALEFFEWFDDFVFRPFDIGDSVDAGGVSGVVESMNLVATTVKTFDNKKMIVPNNKIMGDVITNATDVD
jgi:hypothetical protein